MILFWIIVTVAYSTSSHFLEKLIEIPIEKIASASWGHPVPEQNPASLSLCPNHLHNPSKFVLTPFYWGSLWHLSNNMCWSKSVNPSVFIYRCGSSVLSSRECTDTGKREIEHTGGENLLSRGRGNWEEGSSGNIGLGMKERNFCPETEAAVITCWNSGALNIKFGIIRPRYYCWLCS